jgi:methionine synthase I (cobalamin-dependent)
LRITAHRTIFTEIWKIHEDFGLPVLGFCCETDDRHMRALAVRMAPTGLDS